MSTSKQIVNGVTWTTIQTLINRSSDFIVKMILARLLFPEDYGLIGMAVVFSGFFKEITNLGFGSAIIQRHESIITKAYLSTAFWTNFIWSLFTFLILSFIIGPLAASFYNEEALIYVIPALGVSILTNPLYLIHRSLFFKELEFKKISRINNIANITSGVVAVILAFLGAGVWALVAQSVVLTIVEMPLYYRASKWKVDFLWDKESFHNIFGFGVFTTLSGLVNRFASQGDYLLVGKLLNKVELGFYSFAFIMTDSFRVQVRQIIDSVMYPIYSKNQHDIIKQEGFMNKSIFFNSLIITPIMGVMFISTELVTYIFGHKWVGSLLIMKIIAVSVVVQIITNSFSTIMRANNLSYIEFKLQLVKVFLFYFPLIFVGTYYYGTIGCSYAVVIARVVINIINIYGLKKYLNIKPKGILISFYKGILPTFISGFIVITVFYFFKFEGVIFVLIKTLILFILIVVLSYLMNKKEIKNLVANFKNKTITYE
ncbi:lipopolysaccharide biosynthesis protein [Flavobacterium sp. J49]|uniref:lipopolysaccharide biosynthesis protein n=1 Tax=Flavobacterium sp. J49 TaxID=2718534 RepID=UPI001594172F|nr:lipopolysaccharide biosynthesis protein [Flavobacterium sp. J49]MBF6640022.1 lipopolysaccharide biosynthesis protein [Flavobacterium sp. J49]NIC01267.1 lipopolysaccharide biosynthesis protein [Flavobacterium sp. J49]